MAVKKTKRGGAKSTGGDEAGHFYVQKILGSRLVMNPEFHANLGLNRVSFSSKSTSRQGVAINNIKNRGDLI
jgi:hypothetical protein